ncbi:MAG TPA: RsmB/NOP family class I SAM-dependent RNA methyltransferase [Hyphomicrobiaceae bacterium]|nr:RsmB/NOP family class I SAM-dependent RNA methyltransferase [Hyphomicrobiaceae bacterium]
MRPGARLAAAMDVIAAIDREHRPASVALADWGRAHRFAGSGDRSAIGTLVFDVLRRRRSLAALMGADTPRALVLGAAVRAFAMQPCEIERAIAQGEPHAPAPLTVEERQRLEGELPADTPADVRADLPAWLLGSLERAFGERLAAEGEAMAMRAPIDLRVNTLKADREKVLNALSRLGAQPTALAPHGIRIAPPLAGARAPNVEAETSHGKGWFEVQDEGSQIAAALAGAGPRRQVLDLCAGAGGKTLALAAAMGNTGQIYAYDKDRKQLRAIFERLTRAGVRNVQVMEGGEQAALDALGARFDVVFIDAPCTGSGTWRRRPDSKWRLKREALEQRMADQDAVLLEGAKFVKPGGRLVYATCSVLPEENVDRVAAFLDAHPGFSLFPIEEAWTAALGGTAPSSADGRTGTLQLTPGRHGTDGFFIAIVTRTSAA